MENVCIVTIDFIIFIIVAHTPFGRVATWVRDTARKTVRIFTSFRDKFWRDDVEDQENEICSPVCEHTDMKKHIQYDKVTNEGISPVIHILNVPHLGSVFLKADKNLISTRVIPAGIADLSYLLVGHSVRKSLINMHAHCLFNNFYLC